MRTRYNSDLESIKKMGSDLMQLVLISYERIELYLENKNKEHLDDIIDLGEEIRRAASGIERFCFELLALQQPVASDLRFLQMEIKLASSQKRIASHMVSVAQILKEFDVKGQEIDFLNRFIDNQKQMAKDGIEAFNNKDHDLALKTIEKDEINNKIFVEAINFSAKENKEEKISALDLSNKILLFKYFERLGDRLARVADLATRL